ncbi:MAG: hypothetical protein A2017_13465 [Lentisphaerae bacterium GWF2_44_16]|nr:MAG: hypothetical protein A2017_13465 [Lentisphaerae bacterium GWF2_44_16]
MGIINSFGKNVASFHFFKRFLKIYLLLFSISLSASEYFVSTTGNDTRSGTTKEEAFKTVAKAFSVLKPGDVLTVCPGEYFESVKCALTGTEKMPITIRAEHKGLSIIRGDQTLKAEFKKVAGLNFTYECIPPVAVKGVIERDSLSIYSSAYSKETVDKYPGTYFYDQNNKKLYLHTSTSETPERHYLTLSGIAGEYGIYIIPPEKDANAQNIIVDGLAFTGFTQDISNNTKRKGLGFGISLGKNCIIKNCTAFLNATGIIIEGLPHPSRHKETAFSEKGIDSCVIENCTGYGNYDGEGFGASILMKGTVRNSSIRNCTAFMSSKCIRLYAGVIENCSLENNTAFLPGDIWDKGNFANNNRIIGNICDKINNYTQNNIIKGNVFKTSGGPEREVVDNASALNITPVGADEINLEQHFADPEHLDYRLQSDSSFRGTGKEPFPYADNVFFVRNDGNDNGEGTSVKKAWKTLKKACKKAQAGQTVYIFPGHYDEELSPENSGKKNSPIIFRRRGTGEVFIKSINVTQKSNIEIEGINVISDNNDAILLKNSENIILTQCVAANSKNCGIMAENINDMKITHCSIIKNKTGIYLSDCTNSVLTANIFSENGSSLSADSVETLCSDYNSYNPVNTFFILRSSYFWLSDASYQLPQWIRKYSLDIHSQEAIPEFTSPEKGKFYLKNFQAFNGRGPLAMPIGPFARIRKPAVAENKDVRVFSTSSTTANIEWQTPGAPANAELHWGTDAECKNRISVSMDALLPYTMDINHYFSIIGLKPGEKYYFKAVSKIPFKTVFSNEEAYDKPEKEALKVLVSETRSFNTHKDDLAPKTYHVSLKGDNKNSGLSENTAFRNISFAATKINAGDTVIIHDGTYEEDIIIKATGDKNATITFKAENPGKVLLKGNGIIKSAFELRFKSWITLDGLYISGYVYFTPDISGCLSIIGGSNNTIKRCILDGRPVSPLMTLVAKCTQGLLIENCVFRNAWSEIVIYESPDAIMRNNVFYGNMVSCITVNNSINSKFTLSHNIICDQVPKKLNNTLVNIGDTGVMREEYNCYFTRLPEDRKKVFSIRRPKREELTLSEFTRKTGKETTSFFANPGMKIIKEYEIYHGDMTGRPHKFVTQEMNMDSAGNPVIALFDDFFASNPKCRKSKDGKTIGLEPDKFKIKDK